MIHALSPSDLCTQSMSPATTSALIEGLQARSAHIGLRYHLESAHSSSPLTSFTPTPCPVRGDGRHSSMTKTLSPPELTDRATVIDTSRAHTFGAGTIDQSLRKTGDNGEAESEGDRTAEKTADSTGADDSAGATGDETHDADHGEDDEDADDGEHSDDSGDEDGTDSADDGSSPLDSPDGDEDEDEDDGEDDDDEEEESPLKFLQNFDPSLFATNLDALMPSDGAAGAKTPGPGASGTSDDRAAPVPGATTDPEFYGNMIQVLTHLLGSSDHGLWGRNAQTPASLMGTSPAALPYSSPANHATPNILAARGGEAATAAPSMRPDSALDAERKGERSLRHHKHQASFPDLQPLISALTSKLGGGSQAPRRHVGEQDLTQLLQSLMQQQQRLQESQQQVTEQQQQQQRAGELGTRSYSHFDHAEQPQQSQGQAQYPAALQMSTGASMGWPAAATGSMPYTAGQPQTLGFADLVFEDEDEDDPDFNPDLNPDLPLPSAWSLAVQDVVGSDASRAAARAVAASATHSPAVIAPVISGGSRRESDTGTPSVAPGGLRQARDASDDASRLHSTRLGAHAGSRRESSPARRTSAHSRTERAHAADIRASPSTVGRQRSETADTDASGPGGYTARTFDAGESAGEQSSAAGSGNKRKRGRPAKLTEEERRRRRLERNAEYARAKRQREREEREEREAEQHGAQSAPKQQSARISKEDIMELRIENKMLRSEVERLRDENARLRAWREMAELEQGMAQEMSRPSMRSARNERYEVQTRSGPSHSPNAPPYGDGARDRAKSTNLYHVEPSSSRGRVEPARHGHRRRDAYDSHNFDEFDNLDDEEMPYEDDMSVYDASPAPRAPSALKELRRQQHRAFSPESGQILHGERYGRPSGSRQHLGDDDRRVLDPMPMHSRRQATHAPYGDGASRRRPTSSATGMPNQRGSRQRADRSAHSSSNDVSADTSWDSNDHSQGGLPRISFDDFDYRRGGGSGRRPAGGNPGRSRDVS